MEINQLRSFAAVVRCGSFSKAAEQLYISQPTVSTHVRALEEKLGCSLLSRSTKRVELTPKGREVSEYICAILELWDRTEQSCRETEKRIVHLGASTIPASYILPELLPEFGRLCPDTYFVIHQSNSREILAGLAAGMFDMGLIGTRPQNPVLDYQQIYRDRMVLVTPVTNRYLALQSLPQVPLEEILREPVILREEGGGKNATAYLEKLGLSEQTLNIAARANDQETVKNLVAGGLGVSIISGKAAEGFVREKRILQFELPDASASAFYLAWRKASPLTGSHAAFRDFAVRKYHPGSH